MPQFLALSNGLRIRFSAITSYTPEIVSGHAFHCQISGKQYLILEKYFGLHTEASDEILEQDAKGDSFGDGIEISSTDTECRSTSSRHVEGIDPSVAQDISGRPVLTTYPKRRRSGRRR